MVKISRTHHKTKRGVVKRNPTKVGTIDIEPRWIDLAPMFIRWLCEGSAEQKKLAREEILRMARVCDTVRGAQKAGSVKRRRELVDSLVGPEGNRNR